MRRGCGRRLLVAALAVAALAFASGAQRERLGTDGAEAGKEMATSCVGAADLLADAAVRGEAGDLVKSLGDGAAGVSGRKSGLPVAEEASRVLDEYACEGACVVARSGWLDLLGRTWGCVIQGEGWVDVCVVAEGEDGGSEVGVMRMDASGLLGEGGG